MWTLYGIESCGTVKKARAWFDDQGTPYVWVDFRTVAPTRAQVERWVQTFGAKALRNTSGGSYRALGAEKDTWADAEWVDAFTADPMLIKRPVIERSGRPTQVGFRATKALK